MVSLYIVIQFYFDKSGIVNENIQFQFGAEVVVHNTCGFTLNNEFWLAGGSGNSMARRQVSL